MIRKKFLMRCTLSWHLPDTVSAEEAEEAGEKYMSTFAAIVFAILTIILAFVLIVSLPVLAGNFSSVGQQGGSEPSFPNPPAPSLPQSSRR